MSGCILLGGIHLSISVVVRSASGAQQLVLRLLLLSDRFALRRVVARVSQSSSAVCCGIRGVRTRA